MDDLIACMSGNMHVSQELAELESFKQHLARTLVVSAQPSPELEGTVPPRVPSVAAFTLEGIVPPFGHPQPFPSPMSKYSSFLDREEGPTPSESYQLDMDDDSDFAALQAAFAGDAFAPHAIQQQQFQQQEQQPQQQDPWAMFRQDANKSVWNHPQVPQNTPQSPSFFSSLGMTMTQQHSTPSSEYSSPSSSETEESMETNSQMDYDFEDEEQAVNNGYYNPSRGW